MPHWYVPSRPLPSASRRASLIRIEWYQRPEDFPSTSHLLRSLVAAALAVVGLAAHAELAGSWSLTSKGQRNTLHSVLTVERTEDGYRGSIAGAQGVRKLDPIVVEGDRFVFEFKRRMGRRMVNLRYVGIISGDTVTGVVRTRWGWWPFSGERKE